MIDRTAIIVGGGPAGASCAQALNHAGIDTLILDKQSFPRPKLCAGWITPRVWRKLNLNPRSYSGSLTFFDHLHVHIYGRYIPIPTRQYAIRRLEFDHFLLNRAGVTVEKHRAADIKQENGRYVIDNRFRCTYLIGAGGTGCPVYRTFFRNASPRPRSSQITTLELEFKSSYEDTRCQLWFFEQGLPGYAWYVPKQNGIINIGIGAKASPLLSEHRSIQYHWQQFARKIKEENLIDILPDPPRGHTYFLRHRVPRLRLGNAFIIGDAAGLATLDMGEGIGPAVESGQRAAKAVISGGRYHLRGIPRYSILDILKHVIKM
ncbi:MAG: NAD(P)/FAD-dependent oxidoreductase [candidate division KSB1 bacterium]|nr:NAD(P)/FAD-dependent oxidoreductase [candidate division KSB1 bacterium]